MSENSSSTTPSNVYQFPGTFRPTPQSDVSVEGNLATSTLPNPEQERFLIELDEMLALIAGHLRIIPYQGESFDPEDRGILERQLFPEYARIYRGLLPFAHFLNWQQFFVLMSSARNIEKALGKLRSASEISETLPEFGVTDESLKKELHAQIRLAHGAVSALFPEDVVQSGAFQNIPPFRFQTLRIISDNTPVQTS